MERISKMWRSALAMVLAICMVLSFCPVAAFAAEPAKKYVSLGDSMTNGYGLPGYDAHGSNGFMEIAGDSYPAQVAEHYGWDLTQLATSAMRVEDLNYILGGNFAGDEWTKEELLTNDQRWYSAWARSHGVKETFVNAVTNADVISMAAGNGNFGVFLLGRITNALGLFGSPTDDAWIKFEDALVTLDPATQTAVKGMYNKVLSYAQSKLPADLAESLTRAVGYTLVSFVLNYNGAMDRIVELNPDVEIIIVGLMNTMSGYELSFVSQGQEYTINMEQILNLLIQPLNAYLAALPAAKQAKGHYEKATIYYTDVDTIKVMSDSYRDMYMQPGTYVPLSWTDNKVEGNNTVRDRFVSGIGSFVGDLMPGFGLDTLNLADVLTYEADPVQYALVDPDKAMSVAVYLGLEEAVLQALEAEDLTVSLDDMMGSGSGDANAFLSGLLGGVLGGLEGKIEANATANAAEIAAVLVPKVTPIVTAKVMNDASIHDADRETAITKGVNQAITAMAPLYVTPDTLVETLCGNELVLALLNLYGRLKMGDGLSAHPSAAGHDDLTVAIIKAYDEKHTVQEDIKENVKYALGELKNFLVEYGPDAADQAYTLWVEMGYQALVDQYITELTGMVDARYTNYIENVLPALNSTIDALNGQKDALNTELVNLKNQLDAKKAELLQVLAEQEITDITPPEFDIDTELGNNEQTQVPENDCAGTGNVADELQAAIADLEHAISVVEALIADVTADIEDMVALATEIAEGVATLEQTLTDVAAAAQDLKNAVDAVVAVLTDDAAKATSKTFMKAFNAARDAALIAVDTVEMLVETVNGDVATIEASIATLEECANALANKFAEDKEAILMQIAKDIPTDALMIVGPAIMLVQQTLEANKDEIISGMNTAKDALLTELSTQKDAILLDLNNQKDAILKDLGEKKAALAAEYGPQIDEALLQLNTLKDQINNEIQTKYAELQADAQTQIDALKLDAQTKIDTLNLELQGYMAQLAGDISDELRAEIQPQIDRINNDIAAINADLACAIEHVNAELKAAHDALVEEVTNTYNDVMTELQNAYDALVDAYNTAVKQLQDAADEAIKALQDAADEAIKALQDAYDEAVKQLQDEADKAIQDLIDAAQKELDKLGEIGEILSGILDGVLQAIRGDISAAQQAISDILNGVLDSVNDLGDALVDLGVDGVNALVDEVTKVINDMLHKATHADLELYGDSIYVALGDGTAVSEGYAEKVGEQLKAEYGVGTTINYAEAGNTVGAELTKVAGRDGIADADLITIGFGNTTILENAIRNAGKVDYNWAELVGEDLVPYVEDALAEAYAEVAKADLGAEMTAYANAMIEGFAYGAVEYAVKLPALIAAIREVNADAVIVVVGQYNPMSGVVLDLDGATLDLSEYVDYFVDAVAVHGIGYAMITGDAIFVEAPEVVTTNTDMSWSIIDLAMMIGNLQGFDVLNPSEAGNVYIANQILEALNISQIGLWGDADGNGIVNLRDAMLILKAANNHDVSINRKLSDVTGDGNVNLADAMWVLKRANKHTDLFPVEK